MIPTISRSLIWFLIKSKKSKCFLTKAKKAKDKVKVKVKDKVKVKVKVKVKDKVKDRVIARAKRTWPRSPPSCERSRLAG